MSSWYSRSRLRDRPGSVVRSTLGESPRVQAARRDVVGDLEQDHRVQRLPDLGEHGVERLCLRERSREPVEDEAVLAREPLTDEVDHEIVRDEVAALENRLDLPPELAPLGHRGAEDVTRRDVRRPSGISDALCLSAFARPLRAQDQDPHADGRPARVQASPYFRKPS